MMIGASDMTNSVFYSNKVYVVRNGPEAISLHF